MGSLGLIVRPSGFRSSFAFRPWGGWGWDGGYPYSYYQPAYSYGDASCPIALALTSEQTAAVRAGQSVQVWAPNQCGQTVSVTVQGAR